MVMQRTGQAPEPQPISQYKSRVVTRGPVWRTTSLTTYPSEPILEIEVSKNCIGVDQLIFSIAPDVNCNVYGRFDLRSAVVVEPLSDVLLQNSFTHEQSKIQWPGGVYDIPKPGDKIKVFLRSTNSAITVGCNIYLVMVEVYTK